MWQLLEADLKAAMLNGDKAKAETLRGLKSALWNETIRLGVRDSGLNEEQSQKILAAESKKRQEAADLYQTGGSSERAAIELAEKTIIDAYRPEQLSRKAILKLIDEQMAAAGSSTMADMGRIIGAVKARAGSRADGALIARLVKEKLNR